MPAKIAVTITAYALVPADEYEFRIAEILSEFERGLQQAGADYVGPLQIAGIPPEVSDTL
jgi:hypothetical protein